MSTDVEVWTCQQVDVEALLPAPDRWQRSEASDEDGSFTCWQFLDEGWSVLVCGPEAIDADDPEFNVPDVVKELLPCVRYSISVSVMPVNPSEPGWVFLNEVVTALATGGNGVGFDVFTAQPIGPNRTG